MAERAKDDPGIAERSASYDAGVRSGTCMGNLGAVLRIRQLQPKVSNPSTWAALEQLARKEVADLVRRFGWDYVHGHVRNYGKIVLELMPERGKTHEALSEPDVEIEPEPGENSPEAVGAKGETGGWTGGQTQAPADPFDCDEGP